jgi:trimeric autotransporter adhesin
MFASRNKFFFYLSLIIFAVLVFFPLAFTEAKTINLGTASDQVSIPGRLNSAFLSGVGNRCLYVTAAGDIGAKGDDCGTASGGDNLGNHIATQNIRLGSYWLSGDGGNEGIYINANGQVGVNTNDPRQQLQVNATTGTEALRLISASDYSPLNIRNSLDSADIFRVDQSGILQVGTVPEARITGLGSLATLSAVSGGTGGTITDRSILDIDIGDSANIAASKIQYGEYFITSAGTAGQVWTSDGSGAGIWQTAGEGTGGGGISGTGTANYIPMWNGETSLSDSPIYNSSGNIGIGTTSPNNLLQVFDLITFNTSKFRTQIGHQAGKYDLGSFNTWIGFQAGSTDNATGKTAAASSNTAVGYLALRANTTGNNNSAQGSIALGFNTTGSHNSAQGSAALMANTTGGYNAVVGSSALSNNDTGNHNTAIGYSAGQVIAGGQARSTGDYGLYLGSGARANANGTTNEIVIGAGAIGQGSHTAVYGNASIAKHIFTNGNVGIGTTDTSAARLTLADHTTATGGIRFRSAATVVALYSRASNVLKTDASFEAASYKVDTTDVIDTSRRIIASNGTITAPSVRSSSYTTTGLSWVAGPSLVFITNATEKMRINTSGNVGIGTTNPASRLDVTGNLVVTSGVTLNILSGTGSRMVVADPAGSLSTQAIPALPSGSSGQTLRYNGGWTSDSLLYNNGTTIGINTTTPSASYKLDVTGDGRFTVSVTSPNFYYSSDRNLKKNIKPLNDSLAKIIQLQGVSFDWKNDGKTGLGLIAQDVALVFPELVTSSDGSLSVQYANLVAPLIEAVKTQQLEIERLTERLESLENRF